MNKSHSCLFQANVQPNLVLYNTMLDVCAKNSRPEYANMYWSDMRAQRIEPDVISYTCYIIALGSGLPTYFAQVLLNPANFNTTRFSSAKKHLLWASAGNCGCVLRDLSCACLWWSVIISPCSCAKLLNSTCGNQHFTKHYFHLTGGASV